MMPLEPAVCASPCLDRAINVFYEFPSWLSHAAAVVFFAFVLVLLYLEAISGSPRDDA